MSDIKSIKFNHLTMRHFMSYNDYTLGNIDKYKIIFISGKNAQGKSTLTSEAPYYSIFGTPLRYKKISDLLSWYYPADSVDPAYSEIGLSFDMGEHVVDMTIRRNILGNDKFELELHNDKNDTFFDLTKIVKVPDFNNAIKSLLDIDEKKFSILYLKSPFSKPIFETDSDLLSSITKAQHINELRKDFKDIISSIKIDMDNLSDTIEKQNSLAGSITRQLDKMLDQATYNTDKEKLDKLIEQIEQLEQSCIQLEGEVKKTRAEYSKFNNKKHEGTALISKLETYLYQLEKEKKKLTDLTARGKCPTCAQMIGKSLYIEELSGIDEKMITYAKMLEDNKDKIDVIDAKLKDIEDNVGGVQQQQQSINSQIRSLSNHKTQLQANLKNYSDNKSNNNEILKKIRTTIMDLNDNLTVIQTDYKIMDSINKIMLGKNSEYINKFYDKKIHSFNIIFKSILSKMTRGKFTDVKIKLNNKPTLNGHIEYESLSTSERKFIDMSFVIAYIVYLSTKVKLKTFILDEFLDNYDKENVIHIYNMIYEISTTYDLQLIITTNLADYLFTYMGDVEDIYIEKLDK